MRFYQHTRELILLAESVLRVPGDYLCVFNVVCYTYVCPMCSILMSFLRVSYLFFLMCSRKDMTSENVIAHLDNSHEGWENAAERDFRDGVGTIPPGLKLPRNTPGDVCVLFVWCGVNVRSGVCNKQLMLRHKQLMLRHKQLMLRNKQHYTSHLASSLLLMHSHIFLLC